jgi:hypothetical protein
MHSLNEVCEVDAKWNNPVCQPTAFLVTTKLVAMKHDIEAVCVSGTLVSTYQTARCQETYGENYIWLVYILYLYFTWT